uniref:zinc transporter ZIP4-like n=1 Tax=Agelaius phoeniceus TaxID=39638 RepID=UPI0023EC49FB|nr:zinc transporter ZIP4-like [Agelaius phoeniceus]
MRWPWLLSQLSLLLSLLSLLSLPFALALPAAAPSRGGPGVALVALEALVASGEGQLSLAELGALVAQAGGRAQCPREPCGECPSVPALLALAGKAPGGTAGLEATELSWLGAAVVATLRDPPDATCGDIGGDTNGDIHGDIGGDTNGDTNGDIHGDIHGDTKATAGSWASHVRALHREFVTDATDVTGNVTVTATSHGGPRLREVAELLAAIEPNYRSDSGHQACMDARGVLAAATRMSPRVGTGRELVALGVLVLRGHRLCPGDSGDSGDTASARCGDSSWHLGDTGDIDTPHGSMGTWHCGDTGDINASRGDMDSRHGDIGSHLGDTDTWHGDSHPIESQHGPTAPSSGDSGDNVTVPTATNSTEHEEQLGVTERYLLGTLTALALALVPLVALALVLCPRCPLCSRCPHGAGCRRCRPCRLCPPRWWRPLLDGLAAGALSGDALLHVLPEALGVHSHSGGGHSEHGGDTHSPPWELLAVLGGLYGGFVLERLLGGLGAPPEEVKDGDPTPDPAQSTQELTNHGSGRAQALLLSAGGAVHRLADGLALGSAFAASGSAGAAAGAGLALHELPRALSDALVLSQSGLGTRRTVALAAAAALPVVPGVVAGLALGAAPAARTWLAALGGGFLLHLALCHMVPAMLSMRSPSPWALLGLQSAGLLGGWALLLLLALNEQGDEH